jgi:hypothetical protein
LACQLLPRVSSRRARRRKTTFVSPDQSFSIDSHRRTMTMVRATLYPQLSRPEQNAATAALNPLTIASSR